MATAAKTALISGANRGIGRELALGLARRGYGVGLLGRNKEALDAVADECRRDGAEAVVAVADVTDRQAVAGAVELVASTLGGIGLLINNAGVIERVERDFLDTDVEETWRVIETNLRGPLLTVHAVLPIMLLAGGGRVINVNSGVGYKAMKTYTGYAISKGGLSRLTSLLDTQFRDRGIVALDMSPGVVETDMTASMPSQHDRDEWTHPETVIELVAAIGEGRLDELAGRFVRAGADTVESLLAARQAILDGNARVLRLVPIDSGDPIL